MVWLPKDWDAEEYEADLRASGEKLARRSSGEDLELEAVADAILAKSRRGITKHSELRDYLSKSQLDMRYSREVYPESGHPEEGIISGIYKRAYNPLSRGSKSSSAAPSFGDEDE
jgi:hypothetical protein